MTALIFAALTSTDPYVFYDSDDGFIVVSNYETLPVQWSKKETTFSGSGNPLILESRFDGMTLQCKRIRGAIVRSPKPPRLRGAHAESAVHWVFDSEVSAVYRPSILFSEGNGLLRELTTLDTESVDFEGTATASHAVLPVPFTLDDTRWGKSDPQELYPYLSVTKTSLIAKKGTVEWTSATQSTPAILETGVLDGPVSLHIHKEKRFPFVPTPQLAELEATADHVDLRRADGGQILTATGNVRISGIYEDGARYRMNASSLVVTFSSAGEFESFATTGGPADLQVKPSGQLP